jgi:hypothetical protein
MHSWRERMEMYRIENMRLISVEGGIGRQFVTHRQSHATVDSVSESNMLDGAKVT